MTHEDTVVFVPVPMMNRRTLYRSSPVVTRTPIHLELWAPSAIWRIHMAISGMFLQIENRRIRTVQRPNVSDERSFKMDSNGSGVS
jgi:hypothetical protein